MDGEAPSAAPAEVNWLGPFVPAYRFEWLQGPLMDMWRDANSDITIVMEQATSWPDTEEKVLIRSAAGGGPDLVQTGETGAVTDFSARGLFASLDPFLEADADISVDLFYDLHDAVNCTSEGTDNATKVRGSAVNTLPLGKLRIR